MPLEWDFDAAFEFGLTFILDGIEEALLRGTKPDARRAMQMTVGKTARVEAVS